MSDDKSNKPPRITIYIFYLHLNVSYNLNSYFMYNLLICITEIFICANSETRAGSVIFL